MHDNIKTYYYENIIIPYYDYIEEKQERNFGRSNDIKKATDCALKLYHLPEHLSSKPSCNDIISQCPAYEILRDITNLSKHKTITKYVPLVSNASQISELVIMTTFEDEEGEYSDSDKVVQITKDDGTKMFLHDVLYEVICFWDKYLFDNGFIEKIYKPKAPTPIGKNKQRAECKRLDLEAVKGMDFKMATQMMKWDYEKNKAVSIDLTGATVQFNVYKPKLTPQIQIANNKTGKISTLDIKLTDEDLIKFNLFETDRERLSFIEKLDYVQEQVANHFKKISEQSSNSD